MLFTSLEFGLFLPIVFALYWFVTNKHLTLQNGLLWASSYFFYACWDYRFAFLLGFSTVLDFTVGIQIEKSKSNANKRLWLWTSIAINLGFLLVFKYYNFFVESFVELLAKNNINTSLSSIKVILPIGISFYTFHGLSYVIDVSKGRIRAERNLIDYAVFVSYFPLLVAGPIERATHLLPQIKQKRTFDYSKAVDGLRQLLWGFFQKMAIADPAAEFVDMIFGNQQDYNGSTLALGAALFSIQIYGDFAGYSNIALGISRLFGIELLRNFNFPYFSRDIAEFWRRWHISLSTWFRDYLYIPLGGSKAGLLVSIRNTFIIFLVSGLWHGANWTFVVWGLLHALYFLPLLLLNKNRKHIEIVANDRFLPTFYEFWQMFRTFVLVTIAWIFFRADSLGHALSFLGSVFSTIWSIPIIPKKLFMLLVLLFFVIEWFGRNDDFAIQHLLKKWPSPLRWAFYYGLIIVIVQFVGKNQQFIYFQF